MFKLYKKYNIKKMSKIKSLFIYYQKLPQPIRYSGYIYLSGMFIYNCYGSYQDSVTYLNNFYDNKLSSVILQNIYRNYNLESVNDISPWEVVKYGSVIHAEERFWKAFIFPFTIANSIIPSIVLALNKRH
jgi:hypothetical protein